MNLISSQRDIHELDHHIFIAGQTSTIWPRHEHDSEWSFDLCLFLIIVLHDLLHTFNCVSNP